MAHKLHAKNFDLLNNEREAKKPEGGKWGRGASHLMRGLAVKSS